MMQQGGVVLTHPHQQKSWLLNELGNPGQSQLLENSVFGVDEHQCYPGYGNAFLVADPRAKNANARQMQQMLVPFQASTACTQTSFIDAVQCFGIETLMASNNLLDAIQHFGVKQYRDMVGTAQGHIGGFIGAADFLLEDVLKGISKVNTQLHDFASQPGHLRGSKVGNVKNAYSHLNSKLNVFLVDAVERYKGGRLSALTSPNRGMEIALSRPNNIMPLNSLREVQSLMKRFRVSQTLGRGLLVFDLNIRVRNVGDVWTETQNKALTANAVVREGLSFGALFVGAPAIVGGASAVIALIPGVNGIIPVLILAAGIGWTLDLALRKVYDYFITSKIK